MRRDTRVGRTAPMRNSGTQASHDRSSCLENPRPEGAESSLTENVTSPFQAEPAQQHPAAVGTCFSRGHAASMESVTYAIRDTRFPAKLDSTEIDPCCWAFGNCEKAERL